MKEIRNCNFPLYPECSNNTSNIEYVTYLNNVDKLIVHEIKYRNCNNKHCTCKKCSRKRKSIFACSTNLKRNQKAMVHTQAGNEANVFCQILFYPVDRVED